MYSHRSSTGPVDLAFTDRYDGVSAVPFDSLNLALVGGDDPADVDRNLGLLLEDFAPGATLADMEQVHGHRVVDAGGPRERCDALVTDRPDVVLMVRVADCVPVLLADPEARVVGAAHAGRQGLVEEVVEACVARMRELGADRLQAWVGPHICGACYEVPQALQDEVAAREPRSRSTTSWGTPALDIGAGVRHQLERAGVRVHDLAQCTLESPDLYSHRRDGAAAGRFAGVIRMRS
ncbi:MAG: peptidoglycan editing factor PgeF [Marmoricola sp.]